MRRSQSTFVSPGETPLVWRAMRSVGTPCYVDMIELCLERFVYIYTYNIYIIYIYIIYIYIYMYTYIYIYLLYIVWSSPVWNVISRMIYIVLTWGFPNIGLPGLPRILQRGIGIPMTNPPGALLRTPGPFWCGRNQVGGAPKGIRRNAGFAGWFYHGKCWFNIV